MACWPVLQNWVLQRRSRRQQGGQAAILQATTLVARFDAVAVRCPSVVPASAEVADGLGVARVEATALEIVVIPR